MVTVKGEPVILNEKAIKAHTFRAGKRDILWDAKARGLGVRVFPSGRKVWIVQFGKGANRQRMQIDDVDAISLEAARAATEIRRGEFAKGINPLEKQKAAEQKQRAQRAAANVRELGEKYLKQLRTKDSTRKEYARRWKYIEQAIGAKKVQAVTRDDIKALHASLRKTPFLANRVKTLAGSFFAYAVDRGLYAGQNPAHGIKANKEEGRERFLSRAEVMRLGDELRAAERDEMHRAGAQVIRLALLTGCRIGEVLSLRWDAIDLERATLTLAESKTGKSKRRIGGAALDILRSIPRSGTYVFPSDQSGEHITTVRRLWTRVRKAAALDDVRAHDLRHSFASYAVQGTGSLPLVGALLGHSSPAMTAKYAHHAHDVILEGADATAGVLANLLAGKTGAKVLPMRRKKRA